MSEPSTSHPDDPVARLSAVYAEALPEVYGYLRHRCGDPGLAEDLAAETFLQAARSLRDGTVRDLSTPWLVTVARHKLVDHWRREERRERATLRALPSDDQSAAAEPEPDERLEAMVAQDALRSLGGHHRAALTLRYVDDLPVADVAEQLGRSVHATEALLGRARGAFRRAYERKGGGSDD